MSDDSYLTPISVVFFVFAVCTSYMFLSANSSKYTYIGDNKFVLFKVMITLSTVALGYVASVMSVSYYSLATCFGSPYTESIFSAMGIFRSRFITTFLLYLSSLWLGLAVAMLPFGHTVYIGNTSNVDMDRTNQLIAVQQTVYALPYYILMCVMSINLMMFIVMCALTYIHPSNKTQHTAMHILKIMERSITAVRPTFGWYFRFEKGKWHDIKDSIVSGL